MDYQLFCGDCLDVLPTLGANSIDTIITDPPYGLLFMDRDWDRDVPGVVFWREMLRVAKPGALLLSFGGARTFHRLACAIEDAGWEIRDCLMWLYGGGFPKGLNLRVDGWNGWGTTLKPAWEPIILAMKPLDGTFAQNAAAWGVAGLNIDGARVGTDSTIRSQNREPGYEGNYSGGRRLNGSPSGRWPANLIIDEEVAAVAAWSRYFYVAKASRAERDAGLEEMEARDVSVGDKRPSGNMTKRLKRKNDSCTIMGRNHHPTVKPLALMRYLCKLTTTPTGGVVLDPFMGSGTTGVAAIQEGRRFIGVELDPQYYAIAERRIANAQPPLLLPDAPASPAPEQAAMFGD